MGRQAWIADDGTEFDGHSEMVEHEAAVAWQEHDNALVKAFIEHMGVDMPRGKGAQLRAFLGWQREHAQPRAEAAE